MSVDGVVAVVEVCFATTPADLQRLLASLHILFSGATGQRRAAFALIVAGPESSRSVFTSLDPIRIHGAEVEPTFDDVRSAFLESVSDMSSKIAASPTFSTRNSALQGVLKSLFIANRWRRDIAEASHYSQVSSATSSPSIATVVFLASADRSFLSDPDESPSSTNATVVVGCGVSEACVKLGVSIHAIGYQGERPVSANDGGSGKSLSATWEQLADATGGNVFPTTGTATITEVLAAVIDGERLGRRPAGRTTVSVSHSIRNTAAITEDALLHKLCPNCMGLFAEDVMRCPVCST